jgi:tetratricopeptide (TPR) repeat protein
MSEVVVYSSPRWRPSKSMIYSAAAVILLTVVIVGAVAYSNSQKSTHRLNAALSAAGVASGKNAKATDDAKTLSQLQAVSSLATTNQQKEQLDSQLALSYESNGNPQEALHYLQLKHQIDPGSAGADAVMEAQLYQQVNDNSLAIAEYKVAISSVNSDASMSASQKNMAVENYNGIIQSLGGSQ